MLLLAENIEDLQILFEIMNTFSNEYRLEINSKKTI